MHLKFGYFCIVHTKSCDEKVNEHRRNLSFFLQSYWL